MTSCTHNKMKTSRESSSSQDPDGNKMNTSGQSRCLEIMAYDGWQGASAELYGTHNKMKTSRQSSCQEPDGNKMNTSAELSVTQVKKLQEIEQRIDKLTGCQGASAELSATLEELEERMDILTDIYDEATHTLHTRYEEATHTQTQGLDKQPVQPRRRPRASTSSQCDPRGARGGHHTQTTPKTTQPVDEQPYKQSYTPRPFEDPRGYQGKEEDAGWLEQHEKAMRGPGHLRYKDFRYTTVRTS